MVLFAGMSDLQKKYYKALLLKDHGMVKKSSYNFLLKNVDLKGRMQKPSDLVRQCLRYDRE